MPTANTSVGISGILKFTRAHNLPYRVREGGLLGIKMNGGGMTWLPATKIISFLICCSAAEVPNENMYVKKKQRRRRKRSKSMCLRLSVVAQLHRYGGLGFLIDAAGSEILIRFQFSSRAGESC